MELSLAISGASCKCVVCQLPLSIFPVYLYEGGSICGRCALPNAIQPTWIRNSAYETIAEFVKFPCQYEKFECVEKYIPAKMKKHEDACHFKQYRCPMPSCKWISDLELIYDHYADAHTNFILTDPRFELDLINKYEESYLIENINGTFTFHISFDNNEGEIYYSLYCIDKYAVANDYVYHLKCIKQFSDTVYSLPELPVNDTVCTSFNKEDASKVLVKDILDELEDPLSVVCAIHIERNVAKARKLSLQKEGPESHLLGILECPVCQEYMVPPIYQCLAGHAICNRCKEMCKEKGMNCPECRGEIGNTRNFRLEQMTAHIEYPCKFSGCSFIGKVDEIKEHETACFLNIYKCPFTKKSGCKWSGFYPNILDHVHDKHPEETLEQPVIAFICEGLDNKEKYIDHNILPACGQLFLVGFCYFEYAFCWTVQYIGPKKDAKNYFYELDFKDNSGMGNRLFIKRPCSPWTDYIDLFEDEEEVLVLREHLLEPLIHTGDLIYSCNIVPVS